MNRAERRREARAARVRHHLTVHSSGVNRRGRREQIRRAEGGPLKTYRKAAFGRWRRPRCT